MAVLTISTTGSISALSGSKYRRQLVLGLSKFGDPAMSTYRSYCHLILFRRVAVGFVPHLIGPERSL